VWVPDLGAAPSLAQLIGGHIDAVCCSVPEAFPQIEAGQLKPLAVMAEERLPDFADIPTAKEGGVEWTAVAWRGLAAPKGTPQEIVDLLQQKCLAVAKSQDFQNFMKKNGFGITIRNASEFAEFLAAQDSQWRPVIEAAGYAQK
jgi:tripartite-type tricarboxylate transporter receptor subunit TctC